MHTQTQHLHAHTTHTTHTHTHTHNQHSLVTDLQTPESCLWNKQTHNVIALTHTHTHAHTHTHTHTRTHTHTSQPYIGARHMKAVHQNGQNGHTSVHMYVFVYIHTYVCTSVHTCACTSVYICMYVEGTCWTLRMRNAFTSAMCVCVCACVLCAAVWVCHCT